jgi:hypothetical protein
VAVLVWTASLTLALVARVLPGNEITKWFALSLFDGGALVWLLVFIGSARGLGQRSVALLLLVLDIIGVILMSGSELILGGQQFTEIPAGLGTLVVYAVGGWTAINLIAAYAYHVFDPLVAAQIEMQTAKDQVEAEAMQQAKAYLVEQTPGLAQEISNRLITQAKADMRLLAKESRVIDVKPRDAGKSNPT